jgi:pimeloyl-ACP methyl ester carboxylesterase
MANEEYDFQFHRTTSNDGTEIVGAVHLHGRPLVLVSGSGDGQNNPFLLPELSRYFMCYSMSWRGNGLSEENPDHSIQNSVEDVAAFAESIGDRELI